MQPSRRSLLHRQTSSGRTNLWYVNYSRRHADGQVVDTELAYLHFFAEQAHNLGLALEILTHGEGETDIATALSQPQFSELNFRVTVSESPVLKWAEDSAEYFSNGTVSVPLVCDHDQLAEAMTSGRRSRWQGLVAQENLEQALTEEQAWIPLGIKVNEAEMVAQQLVAAQLRQQSVEPAAFYFEGGNIIVSDDAQGETILLIGKDCLDATAQLQNISGDRLLQTIAEAWQLASPAHIIPVEQPGQFHLDMGILGLGQGQMVVNDSTAALHNAQEMAELAPCATTETMAALLELQTKLEAIAAQDLVQAGLNVRRENLVNGVFYNFCNGEFVEGQDGQSYYLTNGAAPPEEEQFRQLMVEEWQAVQAVIFAPRELTHKSLQERGGLGCRIKGARCAA